MKKIFIACFAAAVFLSSCDNSGSSTVSTYEHDDDTLQTMQKDAGAEHEGPATDKSKPEKSDSMKLNTGDTATTAKDTSM